MPFKGMPRRGRPKASPSFIQSRRIIGHLKKQVIKIDY
jgi:hypothetical protein